MLVARKYKMYSAKQKHLHRLCNINGWVYNHAVALCRRYYRIYGKSLNNAHLQRHMLKLRKRNEAWQKINSQTIQETCQRIAKSYTAFFKWCKTRTGRRKSPPKFKKSKKYKSFTFKKAGFKLSGNQLTINSIGKTFKFFKSRDYGQPKTVTLKRDFLGDFYIIITCEISTDNTINFKTGKTAGFDFSMPKFLISSGKDNIDAPRFFYQSEKQVAKANRKLSKKIKGSNNRKKAKLELARLHKKINNRREDYQWKLANDLVKKYDVLTFENLNIEAFKKLWGKKVSDWALYSFLLKIEYLSKKYDKEYFQADRFFASSKTCSCCGHKKEKLELSQRTFVCESCGSIKDRDENASDNLNQLGRKLSTRIVEVSLPIGSVQRTLRA